MNTFRHNLANGDKTLQTGPVTLHSIVIVIGLSAHTLSIKDSQGNTWLTIPASTPSGTIYNINGGMFMPKGLQIDANASATGYIALNFE